MTNTILPHMLSCKVDVIVNMVSMAGLTAGGDGAAYTASKHAIVGYSEGIRANAIASGAIQTPMNQADFADDAVIPIDGGWIAK